MAWSEDVLERFDAYGWHTAAGRGRQRPRRDRRRDRSGPDRRPPEPHRRPDAHRLRQPQPAGHAEGPRPAARRGRGPAHQGGLRLGSRPALLRPRRRARACSSGRGCAGRDARRRLGARASTGYRGDFPTSPASSTGASPARCPTAGTPGCRPTPPATEIATRNARQDAIQALAGPLPELFGGAADLSESNLTDIKGGGDFERRTTPAATSGSASASTRWAASPTASPTTAGSSRTRGTFLNFSDYMRGSVRLAALSGLHVIYVWTHDSVGLGEDGPTHQPVEHYAALRAMPEPVVHPAGRRQRDGRRVGARRRAARTGRSRWR